MPRPARGQATPICITWYRLHHIGYRATFMGNNVAEWMWSLFEDVVVFILFVTSRGVAPGVAPTRKKRGPRPHPTGRRGRLPFWTATPRRAFPGTLSRYMDLHIALVVTEFRRRVMRMETSAILAVAP